MNYFRDWSSQQVSAHNAKVSKEPSKGVPLEMELHKQIMAFCDSQFPRWRYIRARSDKRSTIGNGVQDFTIFLPNGKTLLIEAKARNEKLKPDQLAWKLELERLGHTVHCVRNFDEFKQLIPNHANE